MDSNKLVKPRWLLPVSVLLHLSNIQNWANAAPQVPCYFIFGDSLSDGGNNNDLQTKAKVNYPPYGIDFPRGPTGRFSDGRNVQDVIVELLGFREFIPTFAESKSADIFQGVNYASGSSGILNETGKHQGGRIPMSTQLRNHKTIIDRIRYFKKDESAANDLLRRCIYSVQIGSNDYINNYFRPDFYDSSRRYSPPQFADMLIQQLSEHVQTLYDMGARLISLYGLGPLGCAPSMRTRFTAQSNGICVDALNNNVTLYNEKLIGLVTELNNKHKDAKFTYLFSTPVKEGYRFANKNAKMWYVPYWTSLTFRVNEDKIDKFRIGGGDGELCAQNISPCINRKNFMFWDGVHPTDAFNVVMAKSFYGVGPGPPESRPYTIMKLIQQNK